MEVLTDSYEMDFQLLNDCGDEPRCNKQEPSKYRRHEEKCLFQLAEIKQSVKRTQRRQRRQRRPSRNWGRFHVPVCFPNRSNTTTILFAEFSRNLTAAGVAVTQLRN